MVFIMWSRASASQIQTWNMCNRRWYFDKVLSLEDKTGSDATNLGTEVHAAIETFLLSNDQAVPFHALLEKNVFLGALKARLAAEVGLSILVEHEFLDETFPVPVLGYIDLVIKDEVKKHISVIDHKTARTFKYLKTQEDLAVDTQARLYLYQVYKMFGKDYTYSFGHHAICTSEVIPERLTIVSFSHDEIERCYNILYSEIKNMRHDSNAPDHTHVDTNSAACYKFPPKGCPHRAYCKGGAKVPSLSDFKPIQEVVAMQTPPVVVASNIKNVYLDAMPRAGAIVQWDDFVRDISDKYLAEYSEHYVMTAYNEGAKKVAAKAWELFKDAIPDGLVLRTSDPAAVLFSRFVADDKRYLLIQGIR